MKEINENKRTWAVNGVAYLFTVLFIYAAVSKILDFESFRVQLAQSPLLSAYAGFISWAVPGIEIVIAIFLMLARFRSIALYASFSLMVMFTAYIFIILNFSDFIPCSCGGVLEKLSWTQHLVFNVVFIVLGAFAIVIGSKNLVKRKLLALLLLTIAGAGLVIIIFSFSEKKMQRNNAFQRRYVPHFAQFQKAYDLHYNSYYFAGLESGRVYLGNVTAPLKVLILDTLFESVEEVNVKLNNMALPFRDVRIAVTDSNIFIIDGTVPVIFKGSKQTWEAKTISLKTSFTAAVPTNSSDLGIRVGSIKTLKNSISITTIKDTICEVSETVSVLPARGDGIFESDGQLLWNNRLKKLIYVYFYSNRYFIIDPILKDTREYRTIDTVSSPNLEVFDLTATGQKRLKRNAEVINNYATTNGNHLFIQSSRLGKLEPEEMLKHASIIDVYNLLYSTYVFSFYLDNYEGSKLTAFYLDNYMLYAIMEDKLVKFELSEKYFNNL